MLYIIIVMYKYYYNISNIIFICNKEVRYKKQNVSGYLWGLLMEKNLSF